MTACDDVFDTVHASMQTMAGELQVRYLEADDTWQIVSRWAGKGKPAFNVESNHTNYVLALEAAVAMVRSAMESEGVI